MIISAGKFLLVEAEEDAAGDGLLSESVSFRLRAIAPKNAVRLAQFGHFFDPLKDGWIRGVRFCHKAGHRIATGRQSQSVGDRRLT
jgi:hypothetical protein